jgi:hypothetical protein
LATWTVAPPAAFPTPPPPPHTHTPLGGIIGRWQPLHLLQRAGVEHGGGQDGARQRVAVREYLHGNC